jgi:hypothetical protein
LVAGSASRARIASTPAGPLELTSSKYLRINSSGMRIVLPKISSGASVMPM